MNTIYNELRKNKAYQRFEGRILELRGDTVEERLNLILPKNIEFTDIFTCGFTFILTDEGKVFSEVLYYKLEEGYLLFSKEDLLPLFAQLEHDITITDLTDTKTLLQVEGKASGEIAQKFYDYDISTLNFKGITSAHFKGKDIYLTRFGYSGEFGYQFLLDKADLADFVEEHLQELPQYDENLNDYVKFEVNHPVSELYQGSANLFELGYAWNLDFTKEDFKGRQEILEQIQNAKMQSIVFSSLQEVKAGDLVYFEEQVIGKVYWVRESLDDKPERNYLGMLQVETYYAHSGIHLLVEGGVEVTTLSNPYIIPESWENNA